MRRTLAVLVATLAACGGGGADRPDGPVEVAERLRDGGYVVFFRHAATDHSQEDDPRVPVTRCEGHRNLDALGRRQSRSIGAAWRKLRIPVGSVLTSGYCRTRDTARLAFGRFTIVPALTGIPSEGVGTYGGRVRALRRLLSTKPPDGENTVVVGHVKNLEAATTLEIEEGDAAVFEPRGDDGYRHVATIPASAWPQLAERVDSTAARASRSKAFAR